MEVEALILAAAISTVPTCAIALVGFALRRNGDLGTLLAGKEAMEKELVVLRGQLKEERDKRDALEETVYALPGEIRKEFLQREDHVRHCGQTEKQVDTIWREVEAIKTRLNNPPPTDARA